MKYSDYVTYFKTAAINNKALAHVENTHHTFYEVDIIDVFEESLKFKNQFTSLLLEAPSYKPGDNNGDNIRKYTNGAFAILKQAKVGSHVDRQLALDETQEIAEQICSKLLNDAKKHLNNTSYQWKLKGLDINSINFNKLGPIFSNHFGWRVEFIINDKFSNNLQLENSKWNNETAFNQ